MTDLQLVGCIFLGGFLGCLLGIACVWTFDTIRGRGRIAAWWRRRDGYRGKLELR